MVMNVEIAERDETQLDQQALDLSPMDERLVISPCDGRLKLSPPTHYTVEGEYVLAGQTVGTVISGNGEEVPVQTSFTGWVMEFLIRDGQPVRASEPILWLRPL